MDSFADCTEESDALRERGDELWEQEGKKKNVEIMDGNRWNYLAAQKNFPFQKQQCKIAIYIIHENLHLISTLYLRRGNGKREKRFMDQKTEETKFQRKLSLPQIS